MTGRLFWSITLCTLMAGTSAAQVQQLYAFTAPEGNSNSGVILASDGLLYGTTTQEVYRVNPSVPGVDEILRSPLPDPVGGVIQASNGNFYGVTWTGGTGCPNLGGCGTIYSVTAEGAFANLYFFDGTHGANPLGGLIQAKNGKFYGTTFYGGAYGEGNGGGTIFEVTRKGVLRVLYNFCTKPNCLDGANPRASLVQGTDGQFYGITNAGGTDNYGTVFKISSAGKLKTLHSFTGPDGTPLAALVQGTGRTFYGTTPVGGQYGQGSIFEITSAGKFAIVYSFCAGGWPCLDGGEPSGLSSAVDGWFSGGTYDGGELYGKILGNGTLFEWSPTNGLQTSYVFCTSGGCSPGASPSYPPVGGYGTTYAGANGYGIIFLEGSDNFRRTEKR